MCWTTRANDETWKVLAEIFQWFTQGFDTSDLNEAKVSLDRLSDGTVLCLVKISIRTYR